MSNIYALARFTLYHLVHTTILFVTLFVTLLVTLLSVGLTLTRVLLEILNGSLAILKVTLRSASKHLNVHDCATEAWGDVGREKLKDQMTGWKWPSSSAEVVAAFECAGTMVPVVNGGLEQLMVKEFMKNINIEAKRVHLMDGKRSLLGGNTTPCCKGNVTPYNQPLIRPSDYITPNPSRTAEEGSKLSSIVKPKLLWRATHVTVVNCSGPLDHQNEVGRERGCIWTAAGQWDSKPMKRPDV
ncbi:BQ2448_3711 [Microbotryum intermedium]|uniref:BQ2448_3711 protein n=1 Tax=Microbotryum intermedium TaxID=269621 RepID=A0A238FDU1_9BASI|nr:BQ2448_3711 [Microbotryum intermedium]